MEIMAKKRDKIVEIIKMIQKKVNEKTQENKNDHLVQMVLSTFEQELF